MNINNINTRKIKHIIEAIKHPHPEKDWLLILFANTFLLIVVVVFSFIIYFFYNPIVPSNTVNQGKYEFIDTKTLDDVISSYEIRAKEFTENREKIPNYIDPSL